MRAADHAPAELCIFRYIQAYLGIFRLCRYLVRIKVRLVKAKIVFKMAVKKVTETRAAKK